MRYFKLFAHPITWLAIISTPLFGATVHAHEGAHQHPHDLSTQLSQGELVFAGLIVAGIAALLLISVRRKAR